MTGRTLAWACSVAVLFSGISTAGAEGPPPTIAIIIDDMGHQKTSGQRLVDLDFPLTLAFLPFRRHTVELAEAGHRNHKEIMLHAPMANMAGFPLGPGALDVGMSALDLGQSLRLSLQSVPHVQGMNNHMGSLMTQSRELMAPVMQELRRYPLYFVDSRTIATTVAAEVALAERIPTLSRDVFLDHEQTEAYVHQQFERLVEIARTNGSAIAIGHPHEVTVSYLEKHLPELDERGIAVATVSALWRLRNLDRPMFADTREPLKTAPLTDASDTLNDANASLIDARASLIDASASLIEVSAARVNASTVLAQHDEELKEENRLSAKPILLKAKSPQTN